MLFEGRFGKARVEYANNPTEAQNIIRTLFLEGGWHLKASTKADGVYEEPFRRKIAEVQTERWDRGGVVEVQTSQGAVGVSEAFAQKIKEAQPYIKHEVLREQQIQKGIVRVKPAQAIQTFQTTTRTTTPSEEEKERIELEEKLFPAGSFVERKFLSKLPSPIKEFAGAGTGLATMAFDAPSTVYYTAKGLSQRQREVGPIQASKEWVKSVGMIPVSYAQYAKENPLGFAGSIAGIAVLGKAAGKLTKPSIKSQSVEIGLTKTSDFGKTSSSISKAKIITEYKRGMLPAKKIAADISMAETITKTGKNKFTAGGFYGVEQEGKLYGGQISFPEIKAKSIKGFSESKGSGLKSFSEIGKEKQYSVEFAYSKEYAKIRKGVKLGELPESKYPSVLSAQRSISIPLDKSGAVYSQDVSRTFKIPAERQPVKPLKPSAKLEKLKSFAPTSLESIKGSVEKAGLKSLEVKLPPIVKASPLAGAQSKNIQAQTLTSKSPMSGMAVKHPSSKLKYSSPYSPRVRVIEEEEYYIKPQGSPTISIYETKHDAIQGSAQLLISSSMQKSIQSQKPAISQALRETVKFEQTPISGVQELLKPAAKAASRLKYLTSPRPQSRLNIRAQSPSILILSSLKKDYLKESKHLGKIRQPKQPTKYQPSLAGIFSGRTIGKAPKGYQTGIGERYPVKKRKKDIFKTTIRM